MMRRALAIGMIASGLLFASAAETQAQYYAGSVGYPYSALYPYYTAGYAPAIATYPSGYWGGYPGYYSSYYVPAGPVPTFPAPAYAGGVVPIEPYPAYYGGYGYTFNYFTHVPGYSFTYYRGRLPRYYPRPYGGFGYYGYGPYGW